MYKQEFQFFTFIKFLGSNEKWSFGKFLFILWHYLKKYNWEGSHLLQKRVCIWFALVWLGLIWKKVDYTCKGIDFCSLGVQCLKYMTLSLYTPSFCVVVWYFHTTTYFYILKVKKITTGFIYKQIALFLIVGKPFTSPSILYPVSFKLISKG